MKYKLLLIALVTLLVRCSDHQKKSTDQPITIVNEFDDEAVKWFKETGNASIKGVAKFKSKSGELRFGEAFRIELMPSCLYTEERLMKIYDNKESGFIYVEDGVPKFTPDPKGYHDTKKTMCNEAGEFEYNNLPAGDYYLIAFMLWDKTGGGVMRHIELAEGETKSVEMINF